MEHYANETPSETWNFRSGYRRSHPSSRHAPGHLHPATLLHHARRLHFEGISSQFLVVVAFFVNRFCDSNKCPHLELDATSNRVLYPDSLVPFGCPTYPDDVRMPNEGYKKVIYLSPQTLPRTKWTILPLLDKVRSIPPISYLHASSTTDTD